MLTRLAMLTRLVQFRILIRMAHSSPTAKQNPVIPIFIVFWAVLQLPVLISGCSRVARKKLTKCQVFTGQANGEPKVRRSRLKKCKRSLRAHLLEDETGRQEQNPVIPIFILKIGFPVEPTVSSFTIRCSQCSHGLLTRLVQFRILIRMAHSSPTAFAFIFLPICISY